MAEDHDLHHHRRKLLELLFSHLAIRRINDTITSVVKDLNDRLEKLKGSKSIVRLNHAFSAITGDVTGGICYGSALNYNGQKRFGREWQVA
jgi:cytochrome P450